jgi:hypothetical protein
MATPNLALTELVRRVSQFSTEELVQLGAERPEELTAIQLALNEASYEKLDARCAEDPLYWAQNWSATENPHWKEQGLPFVAPFPQKPYFPVLFDAFKTQPRLFVCKSREMLTSWCCMVYATHRAQWAKAEVVVQTAKEEKARRLVEYAAILYRNQPEWLQRRHPLKRDATALALEWADGGKLYGIPGGEDQIRMYHPTIVIFDEAAFLPAAEASYNASNPVAKQIIAISSAAPGWFADECSL